MEARMTNPAFAVPDAMKALQGLGKVAEKAAKAGGVSSETLELLNLRASQINGCGVCVDMHARSLKQAGETDERIWSVAAWREAPYYTEPERAALALTEAATRLADRPDAVPDDVWAEAAKHFDEPTLAALVLWIANINVWNRLNVTTRQIAGAWKG